MANIFQQQINPVKPKILANERIFVYVPNATNASKGIASFNGRDFGVADGHVSLRWPMEMIIEQLGDPLSNPAMIKLLGTSTSTDNPGPGPDVDKEFVHTGRTVMLRNPVTGGFYASDKAEVKLKRDDRDAFLRPDLVQLDEDFDFEIDPLKQDLPSTNPDNVQYNKYTLKRNNPLVTPSLVKLDSDDFEYTAPVGTVDGFVEINHPRPANNSGTDAVANLKVNPRTGGFGLQRIQASSAGHLKYAPAGDLQVDMDKVIDDLEDLMSVKPTYGGTLIDDGFDISTWTDAQGRAIRDANGNSLLKITKDAVGLSKVANKFFADWRFVDFGTDMQDDLDTRYIIVPGKTNPTAWDEKFGDWAPPTIDKATPQKWLTILDAEDESLKDSIRALQLFLGIFDTELHLNTIHPAAGLVYGSFALVFETGTLWAVRPIPNNALVVRDSSQLPTTATIGDLAIETTGWGNPDQGWEYTATGWEPYTLPDPHWEWYDTGEAIPGFMAFIATDPDDLQQDGVPSVGSSGLWIQSDHVHPHDDTKLSLDIFKDMEINYRSVAPGQPDDFKTLFWNDVNDTSGNALNTDYTVDTFADIATDIPSPNNNDTVALRDTEEEWIYDLATTTWMLVGIAQWPQIPATIPNPVKTTNIPFVRTSQYVHNWQGSTTFTAPRNNFIWAGDEVQFATESTATATQGEGILFVDDGESLEPGTFINSQQLSRQGITIASLTNEHFAIVDRTEDYEGLALTMKNFTVTQGSDTYQRRELVPIEMTYVTTTATQNPLVVGVPTANGESIDTKLFAENRLLTFRNDGTPVETAFDQRQVLLSPTTTPLTANRMLKSDANNQVSVFNSGTVTNAPIVSNGANDVITLGLMPSKFVLTDMNGGLETGAFNEADVVMTERTGTGANLTSGRIVIAGASNTVNTAFDSGTTAEIPLVANGSGGVKTMAALTGNRLLMSNAAGTGLTPLAMTATNAGQLVGVNGTGTGMTFITMPTTLPVSSGTNPGTSGYTIVVGSAGSNPNTIYFY